MNTEIKTAEIIQSNDLVINEITNKQTSTVSNGLVEVKGAATVVVESKVDAYTNQFFYYAEKTVENTLKMCKVVSLAKEDMKAVEYSKFCKEIGLKEESSTVRKYLAIGQRYDQFIQYADRLPNSWTSLYSITQIPAEKFVELIEGATTFSDFTANDLKQLLNGGSVESPKKKDISGNFLKTPAAQIYFDRIPTTVDWNTLKMGIKILVEKKDSGIRIEWSDIFEKNHKRQLRKNELNAKQKRRSAKESQRKIDQQDFYNHPLFEIQD